MGPTPPRRRPARRCGRANCCGRSRQHRRAHHPPSYARLPRASRRTPLRTTCVARGGRWKHRPSCQAREQYKKMPPPSPSTPPHRCPSAPSCRRTLRRVQREDVEAALVTRSIWVEGGWGAASIAQSRQHKQFESPTSGVAPPQHHHRRAVLPRPTPLQPDTPHYVADGKKGLTAQTVVATNPRARKQRPVRGGGGVEMRQAPVGSVGSQFQELSPSRPVRPLVHIAPPRTSEHIAIDAGVVPSRSACGRTEHDGRKIVHGPRGRCGAVGHVSHQVQLSGARRNFERSIEF